jgi:hypothetical protein
MHESFIWCNLRFDECYVHDVHYYVLVGHDVSVVSVTSKRQLVS